MPSETTPRILRGGRFFTSTTVLPGISSGLYHFAMPETTVRVSPPPMSSVDLSSLSLFSTFSQARIFAAISRVLKNSSMVT